MNDLRAGYSYTLSGGIRKLTTGEIWYPNPSDSTAFLEETTDERMRRRHRDLVSHLTRDRRLEDL